MNGWLPVSLSGMLFASVLITAQDPPTFRSDVRAVTVNASVRLGRQPLPGLGPSDFIVHDNGVLQTVTHVVHETVPTDLTLIVDVSQSEQGALQAIERDAQRLIALLRSEDRVRVLAIDTYVHELVPLSPRSGLTVRPMPTSGGWSAVNDAISAALLVPADPNRRRFVVALTDGQDNTSATSGAQLVRIARATDSVLTLVEVPPSVGRNGVQSRLPYFVGEPNLGAIRDAVLVTGGEVLRPSMFGDGHVDTVRQTLEMFRRSYVLHYSATGVAPGGWHQLEVRIKDQPNAVVLARRGYFGS